MSTRVPRRPALPLAIAALIGVTVGPALGLSFARTVLPALALCAPLACGVVAARSTRRGRARWRGPAGGVATALIIIAAIGLAGAWAAQARAARDALDPQDGGGLPAGPLVLSGTLEREPWPGAPGRIDFVIASGDAHVLVDAPEHALHEPQPLAGARLRIIGRAAPVGLPRAGRDPVEGLRHEGLAARVEAASVQVESPGRAASALVDAASRDAGRRIDAAVAPARAPLFRALLLGERGGLSPGLNAAFRATGTVHLLSISGLHVTLLALVAGGAVRVLGLGRLEQVVAVGLAIAGYVALAGASVPTLRSAASGLVAHALIGRGDTWNRLAVAAIAVLGWDPLAVSDVGALLSFGTVAAILVLDAPIRRWLDGGTPDAATVLGGPTATAIAAAGRWSRRAVAQAMAAFLASAPLVGLVLGDVPLAGLVVNPPVIALCGVALGLAAAGLVVGSFVPPVGHALLALADLPAAALLWIVDVGAAVPGTRFLVPVPAPAASVLAVGLLALAAARASARGSRDRGARALGVAGAALVIALLAPRPPAEPAMATAAVGAGLRLIAPLGGGAVVLESGGVAVGVGRAPARGRDRPLESALGCVPVWIGGDASRSPSVAGIRIEAIAEGAIVRIAPEGGSPAVLVLLADPKDLGARLGAEAPGSLDADAVVILARARVGSLRDLLDRARPALVVTDCPPRGVEATPLVGLDHRLLARAPARERGGLMPGD